MTECIDLREAARTYRWRWRFEESCRAEQDVATKSDGRWYVEILCKRGLIYAWGGDELAAFTDVRGMLGQLLAVPGVYIHQRGDQESTVRFPSAMLPVVAGILRAKRRGGRAATAEDRTRLAKMAFRPALLPPENGLGSDNPDSAGNAS